MKSGTRALKMSERLLMYVTPFLVKAAQEHRLFLLSSCFMSQLEAGKKGIDL